ncbi:MAG TPA: HEPN domain-containing protein, partial [Candidatus Megaira endosymbiont of Nemacystus decipiens]|nr:HEPN domain-containing protein [Candidatus Megaera endosymbiont of Nemacystus decipiens]
NKYKEYVYYRNQTKESIYNAILLVFTGNKPKTHDMETLKGMVSSYHEDLLKIFHFDTQEDTRCCELLRDAYVEAHYNKNYKNTEEQLSYLTTRVEKLKYNPPISIIIESISTVNKQLRIGQYFFSDIKKEGILLYDGGNHELSEPAELDKDEVRKIAKEDYDYWYNRGSGFFVGVNFYAHEIKEPAIAAFNLHQSTESFYNTILLVFTGYKPKTHDIETLKGMVSSYHEDLLKIFHFDTQEQTRCFELLRDAYVEARYNKEYRITEEQLTYLTARVEKLKNVTKKICLAKIESYR